MPHPDDTRPQPQPSPPHGAARAEQPAPPTGLVQVDPRLLAELQARLTALEAWRAHQSDLLDELLNPTNPAATRTTAGEPAQTHAPSARHGGTRKAGPGPGTPAEQEAIDGDALIDWVHRHVTAVIARPLRGDLQWCPQWWDHAEAVFRFEALRRAWTELAAEPGAAMSVWIREHLDPCLRELLTPLGPFADCTRSERVRILTPHAPLPTRPTLTPQQAADPTGGPAARPQPR